MSKFHWKTPDLIKALKPLGLPIHNTGPGGDYDTDELFVELDPAGPDGERGFHISGFSPQQVMTNTSDAFVDAITLGDGRDSRGGLTSKNARVIQSYADIRIILSDLLADTETWIADHYDELF